MSTLTLEDQEITLSHPNSNNMFQPSLEKPFVATPAAIEAFGQPIIIQCLGELQQKADQHWGLDYLQVFAEPETQRRLWFIEDGDGGAITALLPSDY